MKKKLRVLFIQLLILTGLFVIGMFVVYGNEIHPRMEDIRGCSS